MDEDEFGHILYKGFGANPVDLLTGQRYIKSPTAEVAKLSNKPQDSITLKLLLLEHYETHYKIFNHDAPVVPPLSLVSMHDKERYDPFNRERKLTENYMLYKIRDAFGYSLSEFLELPRAKVEALMEIAANESRKAASRESATLRELAVAGGGKA